LFFDILSKVLFKRRRKGEKRFFISHHYFVNWYLKDHISADWRNHDYGVALKALYGDSRCFFQLQGQIHFKKTLKKWNESDAGLWANRWYLLKNLVADIRSEKTKNKKPMNSECIVTLDKNNMDKINELINIQDLKDIMNAKEIKQGKFKVEFI